MSARKLIIALIVFLALVTVAAGTAAFAFTRALKPLQPAGADGTVAEVKFIVAPGESAQSIAARLEEQRLIRSRWAFMLLARFNQMDTGLQAGTYMVKATDSPAEMLDLLLRGEVATKRFTVPEGLTVDQILTCLADQGMGSPEAFRKQLEDVSLVSRWLPETEEERAAIRQPFEGYLFPDTYTIPIDLDERGIVERMLSRFAEIWSDDYMRRAEELGMTPHEIVTLASIVERETRCPSERPLISAVFHNRLAIDMKLDADPTVRYALDKRDGIVLYSDLECDSPYNTYKYAGLPPGPIACPGLDSIRAALYPADVDYFYFVAKQDDDGTHAFARTYSEHLRNVSSYQSR